MFVSPKTDCPHIEKNQLCPLNEFKKIPFFKLKCENCSEASELWICISCGKAYCGRYVNKHYNTEHYSKNKSHCLCISMLDLSVWCYKCTTAGFDDPGSYIESPISSQYVKILSDFKFSEIFNPSFRNINPSLGITKEKCSKIKYENFIELLKNNKFKTISFLVGAGISTSSGLKDFGSEGGFFQSIKEKYKLEKVEDFFSKKFFIENPELFYSFLKDFKSKEYKPNITHYFMKYMIDKGICNLVFTQNFDGLEEKAGIPQKNIVYANGCLNEGHCISCNEKIDINVINQGIMELKIIKCPKCNGPCKPKIVLDGEDLYKDFYEKANYLKYCDLYIIIGTELKVAPFSDLIKMFNRKNSWIVLLNKNDVGKFNFNDISNQEMFVEGKCEEIILKIIKDCGWLDEFNSKFN